MMHLTLEHKHFGLELYTMHITPKHKVKTCCMDMTQEEHVLSSYCTEVRSSYSFKS